MHMSTRTKRAAAVIVLAALAFYRVMRGVRVTGAGGLGAVSFGLGEVLAVVGILAAIVSILLYWRSGSHK